MSFDLAAPIAIYWLLLPVIQQMKWISAKWQTVNHRTKQVDKLLSQKINYNSVHPHHKHTRHSCECRPKTKMLLPLPLLQQQQFNQSNLHLNEQSNRLFLDLQAHTFKHRKTSCCSAVRMNINNINNAVYFKARTQHSHHFRWVQKRQMNRFPGRRSVSCFSSIITSLNENLNTKEYDNWLSQKESHISLAWSSHDCTHCNC